MSHLALAQASQVWRDTPDPAPGEEVIIMKSRLNSLQINLSRLFHKIIKGISALVSNFSLNQIRQKTAPTGSILNLIFLSPILLGDWSSFARAGDSMSMPIHYCLAVVVFALVWLSTQVSAYAGMTVMLAYLSIMGGLRRELIPSTGYITNDPITLISTIVSIVFFIRLMLQRRLPNDTNYLKKSKYLLFLMFISIFNPLQGGIQVGLGGVIFLITPLLWSFWGNVNGNTPDLYKLIRVFIFFSIVLAIKGLYQQLIGFSDVEKYWAAFSGGTQFLSMRSLRPFGFSPSFAEYVQVLVIGCALCWVNILNRKYFFVFPFVFLFVAVFLSSSRGAVINIILSVTVLWSVQGQKYTSWWPRLTLALVIAIVGLSFGIDQVKGIQKNDRSQEFINHQIIGLQDPLGKTSTGGSHLTMILGGIATGFKTPMGFGLGSGTLSAAKFGYNEEKFQGSTEFDISNMFVSLGFIGGGLYLVIIAGLTIRFMKYWYVFRDGLVLFPLSAMFSQFGQMMTGSHYLPTMFLWLIIGFTDRIIQKKYTEKTEFET